MQPASARRRRTQPRLPPPFSPAAVATPSPGKGHGNFAVLRTPSTVGHASAASQEGPTRPGSGRAPVASPPGGPGLGPAATSGSISGRGCGGDRPGRLLAAELAAAVPRGGGRGRRLGAGPDPPLRSDLPPSLPPPPRSLVAGSRFSAAFAEAAAGTRPSVLDALARRAMGRGSRGERDTPATAAPAAAAAPAPSASAPALCPPPDRGLRTRSGRRARSPGAPRRPRSPSPGHPDPAARAAQSRSRRGRAAAAARADAAADNAFRAMRDAFGRARPPPCAEAEESNDPDAAIRTPAGAAVVRRPPPRMEPPPSPTPCLRGTCFPRRPPRP